MPNFFFIAKEVSLGVGVRGRALADVVVRALDVRIGRPFAVVVVVALLLRVGRAFALPIALPFAVPFADVLLREKNILNNIEGK